MPIGMHPARFDRPYDREVEADLDAWEDARADKDYDTADSIRASLRQRGVSPAKERPHNPTVQEEIDMWQRAKAAKDYQRSDRIRENLRANGVDPDGPGAHGIALSRHEPYVPSYREPPMMARTQHRVQSRAEPARSTSTMDEDTKEELRQWFEAKDARNFDIADSIRDSLRKRGIEPAKCQRPGASMEDAEEEIRQWYEAKDAKNYEVADSIRDGLRARGIEPQNCPRPHSQDAISDPVVAEELRAWHEAKEQRNFGIADEIRDRLRAQGIEPAHCPHPDEGSSYGKSKSAGRSTRSAPYSASSSGIPKHTDRHTEAELARWLRAKQDKDFATADAIRAKLREQGVDPDRPRR
jgi:cysteinyl-tRNA synthetase